jgi:DivIVA domain-containing protein
MPLTPEDVSNKRFTPVRLREGYDMGEVDQFLDEVEAELVRLNRENDDLRSKLSGGQGNGASPAPVAEAEPQPTEQPTGQPEQPVADVEPEPVVAAQPEPVTEPAAPSLPSETIKVTTVAEASSAATKLLELATRNADELVIDAQQQAERILDVARSDAERLESDARTRSEMLDSETAERRQQLFSDLDRDKEKLGVEVENLRAFEREYRAKLKTYFEQQLSALDGNELDGAAAPGEGSSPRRLTSLLSEDDDG